jgi:DNA-binding CsgD family transcriptional regulator
MPKTIKRTEHGYECDGIHVSELTPRESQALLLRAHGLSYRECAEMMNCSANAVQARIGNLFYKLNANSTPELTATPHQAQPHWKNSRRYAMSCTNKSMNLSRVAERCRKFPTAYSGWAQANTPSQQMTSQRLAARSNGHAKRLRATFVCQKQLRSWASVVLSFRTA